MRIELGNLKRLGRKYIGIVGLSVAIVGTVCSILIAYLLRFDFSIDEVLSRDPLRLLLPAILLKSFVFWRMNVLHGWWKYASLADIVEIFRATVYSSLLLTVVVVLAYRLEGIPRSVLVLDAFLTFCFLASIRFAVRLIQEIYKPAAQRLHSDTVNILIIGAGEAGQSVAREIKKSSDLRNHVVGYLDDDPLKSGLKFQGVSVLGRIDEVGAVVADMEIAKVIVAIPGATGREMRRIVSTCSDLGLKVQTLPGLSDLIDGKITVQQIRDVDVRDLLGRRSINLDATGLEEFLGGKCVLVTGAAGSIGSELCRQILRFEPSKIVLLDSAESPLFFLDRELRENWAGDIVPIIGNVRSIPAVQRVFSEHHPQIVFHAAAYKHVPLMEDQPDSAVSVNVLGTKVVSDVANESEVEAFVLISTDKAVNPVNVMGATKRCAEMYVQSLSKKSKTRFVTVRFGNVLDSAGSVIPIFRRQIKSGGPLTVTHPEVTRFFMTIPEAAQLVLQAGWMGSGGELYLLDMGESVKIVYLAEEMIRLSGLVPYEDIDIQFSGLRPGEKLFEELLLANEGVLPTRHESIKIAKADTLAVLGFEDKLERLLALGPLASRDRYLSLLVDLVPEYTPEQMGRTSTSES